MECVKQSEHVTQCVCVGAFLTQRFGVVAKPFGKPTQTPGSGNSLSAESSYFLLSTPFLHTFGFRGDNSNTTCKVKKSASGKNELLSPCEQQVHPSSSKQLTGDSLWSSSPVVADFQLLVPQSLEVRGCELVSAAGGDVTCWPWAEPMM